MKRNIRNEVYETNSSSVHSIVVMDSGLESSKFELDDEGYIVVPFGKFGKDVEYFTEQEDKLSYLITKLYYETGWDIEDIVNSYEFHYLEEAIMSYVDGCLGIKIDTSIEPEIDHQSNYKDFIDWYDADAVIGFVFGKYIALKTSCD